MKQFATYLLNLKMDDLFVAVDHLAIRVNWNAGTGKLFSTSELHKNRYTLLGPKIRECVNDLSHPRGVNWDKVSIRCWFVNSNV